MAQKFLRLPQVETITGYKRSSIYRLIQQGEFPAPIKIGRRASAWLEEDIESWANKRILETRQQQI
jgi:prophage regulatory protein